MSPRSNENPGPVKADTMIADMIRLYPATASVLEKYNLYCNECALLAGATVSMGAVRHHLDLHKFLKELNHAALGPSGGR